MSLRLCVGLMVAGALAAGCGGVPPPPQPKTAADLSVEMPPHARKLMPRAESAMTRALDEASDAYPGLSNRSWGPPPLADEWLQKVLEKPVSAQRVLEGWVARLTYVVQNSDDANGEAHPVSQLALQLPDRFLDRFGVYYRAENYDRQSGYYPVPDVEIKKFKSGEWVKFSGVLQSESLPRWNVQGENDQPNLVWLGTITLTALDPIAEKPR